MKHIHALTLGFCLFSLSACQTWNGVVEDISSLDIPVLSNDEPVGSQSQQFVVGGNCPQVEIVNELSMLQEYIDISTPESHNLISGVNLTQAEGSCSYSGKSATVDIKLAFDGRLGPRARAKSGDRPFFSYPFFVAVTQPNGTIMAKEVFAASITYDANNNDQTYYESMRQIIPINDPQRGHKYKILVGFQLTQDQLNRNRIALQKQNGTFEYRKAMEAPGGNIPPATPPSRVAPAAGEGAPISLTPATNLTPQAKE